MKKIIYLLLVLVLIGGVAFLLSQTGLFGGNLSTTQTAQDADIMPREEDQPQVPSAPEPPQVELGNIAPIAMDDTVTTLLNTPVTISPFSNDTDPEEDPLVPSTTVVTLAPAHGTLTWNYEASTVDFAPETDYLGNDTFKYTVEDDQGKTSNEATVTITVQASETPVNQPPLAVNDTEQTSQGDSVAVDVLANDTDNGTLNPDTVVVQEVAENGTTAVDTTDGLITYTPDDDFHGTDTFTYTVKDDLGLESNEATVTITVEEMEILESEVYQTDCEDDFTDIREADQDDKWYTLFVCNLARLDIVQGRSENKYVPGDDVTNAEFIKMILEATDQDVEALADEAGELGDVPNGKWYTDYMRAAHALDLFHIADGGYVYPNRDAERRDMFIWAARLFSLENYNYEIEDYCSDVSQTDPGAYAIVSFMDIEVEVNGETTTVATGNPNGTCTLDANTDRAETAALTVRILLAIEQGLLEIE